MTNAKAIQGARVPAANLLGAEGQGMEILDTILCWERLSTSAGQLGNARRCLDEALKYSLEREAYGVPISFCS